MVCNCNNNTVKDNTIKFVKGTSLNLTFNFDEDISSYTDAEFTIRSNYEDNPIINKTVSGFSGNSLNLVLTPDETNTFTQFDNGQNSKTYIWGLDLIDSANNIRVNVFPKTGLPAPLCIVYKHVVEG